MKKNVSLYLLGYVSLFLIFLLLILLGQWQWKRYQDKLLLEKQYEKRQESSPTHLITLLNNHTQDIRYSPVYFTGKMEEDTSFLLDNQSFEHRIGFRVFSVVTLKTGEHILVERGWIPKNRNIHTPVDIPPWQGSHFQGILWPITKKNFTLTSVWPITWPKIIPTCDIAKMEKSLGYRLLPWIVKLDHSIHTGIQKKYPFPGLTSARHLGYAMQWWSLAFVWCILCFFALGGKKYLRWHN